MKSSSIVVSLLLAAAIASAQDDRGTITATVADPAGAVVSIASELSVSVPGFKKYVRQGLTVQVAQTSRINVALEVGAASESVTVQADASLLKTESGELSH